MTKEQKAKLNKEFGLCMKVACNYKPPKIELTAEKTMKLKLASTYGKMVGGSHE